MGSLNVLVEKNSKDITPREDGRYPKERKYQSDVDERNSKKN